MAHAYTPGLKATEHELLRKRRILPLKGDVLVEVGAAVGPDDVVARTYLPGKVEVTNVANQLGVDQSDVPSSMIKGEGDAVEQGEIIARARSFFGLFKSDAKATMGGTIESISGITGQVIIRGPAQPVEVRAYVTGKVIEIVPEEGVVVEARGSFIQGIFGIGGETHGEIRLACESASEVLTEEHIKPEHAGKILIGGSLVTAPALRKAIKLGVAGVVVGGFDDEDLRGFLGYDLGVAITGHENLGVTLIVTEGFGRIDMAPGTFDLLKRHQGDQACINGATQIRAGVIRPEVIIPTEGEGPGEKVDDEIKGIHVGSLIRVIRAPFFGTLATVTDLPPKPVVLESGSRARAVEVRTERGESILLPRANVELIER